MKTTVVPAQITTVEDKVAGSLSFTQLILLTIPVFLNGAVFILFPPLFNLTPLKFAIGMTLAFCCFIMAFRIRGKLILQWIIVLARYNNRPTYYIYNKNDLYLRDATLVKQTDAKTEVEVTRRTAKPRFKPIPTPELVRIETAVSDPRSNFHFEATKGGSRVLIHEIKD